jgi:hypothetical protein
MAVIYPMLICHVSTSPNGPVAGSHKEDGCFAHPTSTTLAITHIAGKNISGLATPGLSACRPYCQSTHPVPTDDDLPKVFAPRIPRTTFFLLPYFQNCDVRKQRSFKLRPATYISTFATSLTPNLSLLLNRSPSQPTNFGEQRKPH